MPQLDRIIIFPQIFWLFVVFTFLYIILTHFFLPKFLKVLKSRKLIIEVNNQEISVINAQFDENQILLKQLIKKNLFQIEKVLKKELEISGETNLANNKQLIDEKIAFTSLNTSLYCDNLLLKSIILIPKALNLKFR